MFRLAAARSVWGRPISRFRSFASQSPKETSSSSSQSTVLLLDKIELAGDDLTRLQKEAKVVELQAKTRKEFIEEANSIKNLVAIYRHFGGNKSVKITNRFDQELVSQLPPSVKFICHNGAGYDQLDIPSLTAMDIQVSNVPTAVDEATSTTALWLMIGAVRKFALAQAQLKASFNSAFPYTQAHDLGSSGCKVLGIVGAGGIGRALAKKANSAFGMKIIYHNRRRLHSEMEAAMCPFGEPAEYVSTLDELCSTSDVISIHCPLNPETKGLIGQAQFQKMKSSAVLINTARGPIIDEEALIDALENNQIAGVGLDVYPKEPIVHNSLLEQSKKPNGKALLLPHVGTLTLETQREMEATCLRNIIYGLKTGNLFFTVAEQKGKFGDSQTQT